MKTKIFIYYIITAAFFATMLGCNTPPDPKYLKDGKQYGVTDGLFRERWWNFYERGSSFLEGGFFKEAAEDYREAIKQRDKDQRRARTYGMHFVDYFPHRDLGVALHNMGSHEEARKELEYSLATTETGKAKFYLNKVRRAIVEKSGSDTAAPSISLADLGGEVTNSFKMDLKGEVEDDSYAEKISVNDVPLFIELSAKKIPFSRKLRLKKGLNEISVKTTDLLGKVSEKKVKVIGDYQGPMLNVKNFADGQEVAENKVVLSGSLADATGVTTLKINDQVLAYNKEREVDFTFTVQLEEGTNKINFAATDMAGNTTLAQLDLVYVPQMAKEKLSPSYAYRQNQPIRVALQGSGVLDTGENRYYAAVQRVGKFRLNLKDLVDTQTVYYDTIYIDGSVTGLKEVQTVKINGEELFVLPGRTLFFNQLVELSEGDNKIIIEVVDAAGNTATKEVNIKREIPKVHQIGSRMSIAVMPFDIKGQEAGVADIVYDNLIDSFFEQDRFSIVSRGAELEKVLQELKLSETDLVDKSKAVKVGRLVAAEAILMGSVRETAGSLEIYARLVNTETSTLLDSKDVYTQDKEISQIQYITNGLALKFKHSFPLIEGTVIKVEGNNIYADFGTLQNIKKEMKFIVFREGEKIIHPITGKVLGSDSEEIGIATVVNVFEDMSLGKLVSDADVSNIKVKDLIITK